MQTTMRYLHHKSRADDAHMLSAAFGPRRESPRVSARRSPRCVVRHSARTVLYFVVNVSSPVTLLAASDKVLYVGDKETAVPRALKDVALRGGDRRWSRPGGTRWCDHFPCLAGLRWPHDDRRAVRRRSQRASLGLPGPNMGASDRRRRTCNPRVIRPRGRQRTRPARPVVGDIHAPQHPQAGGRARGEARGDEQQRDHGQRGGCGGWRSLTSGARSGSGPPGGRGGSRSRPRTFGASTIPSASSRNATSPIISGDAPRIACRGYRGPSVAMPWKPPCAVFQARATGPAHRPQHTHSSNASGPAPFSRAGSADRRARPGAAHGSSPPRAAPTRTPGRTPAPTTTPTANQRA